MGVEWTTSQCSWNLDSLTSTYRNHRWWSGWTYCTDLTCPSIQWLYHCERPSWGTEHSRATVACSGESEMGQSYWSIDTVSQTSMWIEYDKWILGGLESSAGVSIRFVVPMPCGIRMAMRNSDHGGFGFTDVLMDIHNRSSTSTAALTRNLILFYPFSREQSGYLAGLVGFVVIMGKRIMGLRV